MEEGTRQFVTVRVGPHRLALPIEKVKEVVRPLPIVALPGGSKVVEGIVELRGAVLPVLDLRKRFGIQVGEEAEEPGRLLVATVGGRIVALMADDVEAIVRVSPAQVQRMEGPSGGVGPVVEVFRHADLLYLVLDPDRLLDSTEFADLASLVGTARQQETNPGTESHGVS